MRLTDIALPDEAFSLCWGCKNYAWSVTFGRKGGGMWGHSYTKDKPEVGDDVKECEEFR